MIVLFTSNTNGGIVQFTVQLLEEIKKMGKEVKCFVPEGTVFNAQECYKTDIIYYTKIKKVNRLDKAIVGIANRILQLSPNLVWFCDDGILSNEVGITIGRKASVLMTLHDAGGFHPSNNLSIRNKIHQMLRKHYSKGLMRVSCNVLLLSEESKAKFVKKYAEYENKVKLLQLGAHVPSVECKRPQELVQKKDGYVLFFGRIDKYKGIENLLMAFKGLHNFDVSLVIAGKGNFTSREQELISSVEKIEVINRYILDEEMIWLFQNARCLVLPYIEATQSGIIPIAYKYNKPVIVSDTEGLTQVVVDQETGFICHKIEDYQKAICKIYDDNTFQNMSKQAGSYYDKYFDWQANISNLFENMGV